MSKSDAASENEPFGRQPQPVRVDFTGDLRDCEEYIRQITRIIENGSYDVVTRMGNQIIIYPRATEAVMAKQAEFKKALRELVDASAYVKPFAGEILSEGENVTVKNMRRAMRFCAAVESAQKLLGED